MTLAIRIAYQVTLASSEIHS